MCIGKTGRCVWCVRMCACVHESAHMRERERYIYIERDRDRHRETDSLFFFSPPLFVFVYTCNLTWQNDYPSIHHGHGFPKVVWSTLQTDSHHHDHKDTHTHSHIYTHTNKCMHECMSAYLYTPPPTHTHTHTCLNAYTHTHTLTPAGESWADNAPDRLSTRAELRVDKSSPLAFSSDLLTTFFSLGSQAKWRQKGKNSAKEQTARMCCRFLNILFFLTF